MVAIQLTPDAGSPVEVPGVARDVEALGYEALRMGEVDAVDVVVPASVAAVNRSSIVIGSLFNVFTRAPTNVALAAAGLGHLAPGRMAVVLGASSPLFVERCNGIPYERPYDRVRDYLHFVEVALSGQRVSGPFATFSSSGFSIENPPVAPPRILVAAAMPRTMRLGSDEADGLVLNWLSPRDLDRLEALRSSRDRVWLSTLVCPSPDPEVVDEMLRPLIADYLSSPAYAGLQQTVGRGPALAAMWERFAAADRSGARAQLPRAVIDELVVSGTPEECGERLRADERRYGIHLVATLYLARDQSYSEVIRDMAC
jgi:alkanesulfonate monooxygenase SsuD/methylene tetrahydromethanopterin reductase-like flavin-dependent oxidoreductase (luciferase family)